MNIKKKNNNHKWLILVAIIMSIFSLMGCNSDGNETISLEYGNAKKMVVGQWIIGDITRSGNYSSDFVFRDWSPGTWLVFFDDGTYSDSSDGGKTPHQWVLTGTSDDSTPYYGGIELEGKEFGIGNLGPDSWILRYPKGAGDGDIPGWELGLDKESDDPGAKPFEPLEPEPVVEKRYLVKEINMISQGVSYYSSRTWYFTYDEKDRIEHFWCVLNDYGRNEFSSTYSYDAEEVHVENDSEGTFVGIGNFLSESDLRIQSFYRIGLSSHLKYGISYTADGYLSEISLWDNNKSIVKLQYVNGNIALLNKPIRWAVISEELNDANIDLNCFISGFIIDYYYSHVAIFEPFGFLGKKSKLLLSPYNNLNVTRDEHNNIVAIQLWDEDDAKINRKLTISYEERIKEVI